MARKQKFGAKIIGGKLHILRRAWWDSYIKDHPDSIVHVEISQPQTKRTLSQNSYYHLMVNHMHIETGNSVEVIKREMQRKFLGHVEGRDTTGKVVEELVSSASLNVDEMRVFIMEVEAHAAEWSGFEPIPET